MAATPTPPCDRCGEQGVSLLFHNLDYLSNESFAVVCCARCGLARTAFEGDDAALDRYYGEAYYGDEGRRFIPLIENIVRGFELRRVRMVQAAAPRPGAMLDIGCGRGTLLGELQARGWQAAGTEFSPDLAAAVERRYGIEVRTEPDLMGCAFEDERFDVVTLWHTLEHMRRPVTTLREIHRILKPGGTVMIEVPNLGSVQAGIGQGRWFHLDTPRHLYHFSVETLRGSLDDAGFSVGKVETFSPEMGFYGMWQSMLNRVTTQPNVLYNLLKRRGSHARSTAAAIWDYGVTLALMAPVGLVGTPLELIAAALGRGGVIRLAAKKR